MLPVRVLLDVVMNQGGTSSVVESRSYCKVLSAVVGTASHDSSCENELDTGAYCSC